MTEGRSRQQGREPAQAGEARSNGQSSSAYLAFVLVHNSTRPACHYGRISTSLQAAGDSGGAGRQAPHPKTVSRVRVGHRNAKLVARLRTHAKDRAHG